MSSSLAIQAIGFDTRRLSGKKSVEIQFFQEAYKKFFLKNGITIRERLYGPFLSKCGIKAYIPNLPLYVTRGFLINELSKNRMKVVRLRQRRLKEYTFLSTKGWNLIIEKSSTTIKRISIKGFNYNIVYFGNDESTKIQEQEVKQHQHEIQHQLNEKEQQYHEEQQQPNKEQEKRNAKQQQQHEEQQQPNKEQQKRNETKNNNNIIYNILRIIIDPTKDSNNL